MKDYTGITYRYLKEQKKRTFLTILGIALSIALLTAIGTMVVSMRNLYIKDAIEADGSYHLKFLNVDKKDTLKIKNNVEVKDAGIGMQYGFSPINKIKKKNSQDLKQEYQYISIKAYDKQGLDMNPIKLKQGTYPKNSNEIIINYSALKKIKGNPKIGDKIKLNIGKIIDKQTGKELDEHIYSDSQQFKKVEEKEFKIVGTIMPKLYGSNDYFTKGITYLDKSVVSHNKKFNVYVEFQKTTNINKKLKCIENNIKPSNVIFNENLLRWYGSSLNDNLNKGMILTLLFIVVLIVVSTIAVIYNAFNISVLERIKQFGILRSIGATPKQIKRIVLKEALILGLISIPLGLVSGVAAIKFIMYFISVLKFECKIFTGIEITISPLVCIISSIIGLFTVYISAKAPVKKAGNVSPMDAIRNSGSLRKENFKNVRKNRVITVLFGIEGEIAYKNLKRNKKRFYVTLFSMVISITLFIVFSSLVQYMFSMGAVGDRVEQGDFYIMSTNQSTPLKPSIYDELIKIDGVEKVYKRESSRGIMLVPNEKINPKLKELASYKYKEKKDNKLVVENTTIMSYGDNVLKDLKDNILEGNIDVNKLNDEHGVFIMGKNNIIHDAQGNRLKKAVIINGFNYKVGDTIEFVQYDDLNRNTTYKNVKYKKLKVIGILDKGILEDKYCYNGAACLITTEKVFNYVVGNNDFKRISIFMKNNSNKQAIRNYLENLKNNNDEISYIDFEDSAKRERNIEIIVSLFLYGFVAVISLIGIVNIINTISTNLLLRKRELSMLRAVGMSQHSVNKMVFLESVFYGIIASIYGVILGTGLSYILYRIELSMREFQWKTPINSILIATLGAIIITVMSAYVPLRKINQGNIIENIRTEE